LLSPHLKTTHLFKASSKQSAKATRKMIECDATLTNDKPASQTYNEQRVEENTLQQSVRSGDGPLTLLTYNLCTTFVTRIK